MDVVESGTEVPGLFGISYLEATVGWYTMTCSVETLEMRTKYNFLLGWLDGTEIGSQNLCFGIFFG